MYMVILFEIMKIIKKYFPNRYDIFFHIFILIEDILQKHNLHNNLLEIMVKDDLYKIFQDNNYEFNIYF